MKTRKTDGKKLADAIKLVEFINTHRCSHWSDPKTKKVTFQVFTGLPSPNDIIQPTENSFLIAAEKAMDETLKLTNKI